MKFWFELRSWCNFSRTIRISSSNHPQTILKRKVDQIFKKSDEFSALRSKGTAEDIRTYGHTPGGPMGPMGPHESPWVPMGPMGPHGSPWVPMGPNGSPWVPVGLHGSPWAPWVPMGPHGSPWVPWVPWWAPWAPGARGPNWPFPEDYRGANGFKIHNHRGPGGLKSRIL